MCIRDSSYNDRVLRNNLTKLYEYIRSTGQVDRDGLTEAATGIARGILKQARSQYPELADMYKGVRKEIKNTKIKLSDQDRADLGEMGEMCIRDSNEITQVTAIIMGGATLIAYIIGEGLTDAAATGNTGKEPEAEERVATK